MTAHYDVDMRLFIRSQKDWLCPYKLGGCVCPKCNQSRENYDFKLTLQASNNSAVMNSNQSPPNQKQTTACGNERESNKEGGVTGKAARPEDELNNN